MPLRFQAKLLDFGLSKAIDAEMGGSMARTFVGTPSYLAPEVEEKPGGRGKPYGTPVDCWSLGAMLYVMLVARFPEFQVQVAFPSVERGGRGSLLSLHSVETWLTREYATTSR